MARHASNYRQARRAAWKALNKLKLQPRVSWEDFNSPAGYDIGRKPSRPMPLTRREKAQRLKGFASLASIAA